MAEDMDKLSIGIYGHAESATKAIDKVITSLTRLSGTLGAFGANTKNLDSVSQAFGVIATSVNKINADKLKTINTSLRSMSYAMDKLSKVSTAMDMSPATESARQFDAIVTKSAQTLANTFGVQGKAGVEAVKNALKEGIATVEQYNRGVEGVTIGDVWHSTAEAIRENMVAVNDFKANYTQLLDYMRQQNASGRKVYLPFDPAEIGEDYSRLRAVLGQTFTSNDAYKSFGDITSFVNDLNSALGQTIPVAQNEADTFMNLVNALKQARGEASNTSGYEHQMITQKELGDNILATILNIQSEADAIGVLNATASQPMEVNSITQIIDSLKAFEGIKVPNIDAIGQFASNLSRLGSKNVQNAVTVLPQLTKALNDSLTTLSKAPMVNQNIIDMTNALANLAKASRQVASSAPRMSTGFNNISRSARNTSKSFKGLASSIGMFYAKFFLIIRAIKGLWSAIGSSMDFVETYNYFDKAMEQVAGNTVARFSELGYESEEAYANSFREASLDLTKKMSGYLVGDDGLLTSTSDINLGMDPNTMLSYQAQFAQMSSSMGVASEQAVELSNALTMIGADLASVRNMEFEDVWKNMASGMVGMSRAVDKYGINIREASLNQELANLGIDATTKQLSSADKAMLRTIVILKSSMYAWGDLAETIEQPRNQLRMLQNNWISLCRSVGNIFSAWVNSMLPYINALVIALQRLAQWIINVFHITIPSTSGVASGSMDDLYDSIYDVGGALDDTSGKAKKLKQNLLGIDELNVINNDDSGSGSGAGGVSSNADLQKAFDAIYQEYQDAWNEAYNNVTSRAQELANGIIDAFKKGDYREIGNIISTKLRNALDSINWDSIFNFARNAGTNLAEFLNGLIRPETFYSIGRTIANGLNTAFYFAGDFVRKFDWKNAGFSLAEGLRGFVENADMAEWGRTISDALNGVLDSVHVFLTQTPWIKVGEKIGEFLKNVKWGELMLKVVRAMLDALSAGFEILIGIFKADAVAGKIVTAIALFMTAEKALSIASALTSWFSKSRVLSLFTQAGTKAGTAMATGTRTSFSGIGTLLTEDLSLIFKAGTALEIGTTIGLAVGGGILAGYMGLKVGEKIATDLLHANPEDTISYMWEHPERMEENGFADFTQSMAQHGGGIAGFIGAMHDITAETDAQAKSVNYLSDRMTEYRDGLGLVVEQLDHSGDAYQNMIGVVSVTNDAYDQNFIAIENTLRALGEQGVMLNDVDEVIKRVNLSQYELTEEQKNWVIALAENYDTLGTGEQAWLSYQYGIQMTDEALTAIGGNTAIEEVAQRTIEADKAQRDYELSTRNATNAQYDFNSAVDRLNTNGMPSNVRNLETVQRSLADHVKANNTAILSVKNYENALGNCSGAVLGLKENINYLDYASTQVAHNGMPSAVAEIMAGSSASRDLAQDLGTLNTVTESTTEYFDVASSYVKSMSDSILNMSGEHIPELKSEFNDLGSTIETMWNQADKDTNDYTSRIYDTVEQTDDELYTDITTTSNDTRIQLEADFDLLVTNLKEKFTDAKQWTIDTFDATIATIELHISDAIGWFNDYIVPNFSESHWDDILSGIPKAFGTAFKNACNVVVGIINSMIDEINDAMDVSWDAIKVNGKTVVEAGSAQIFKIDHLKGFAQGGFPTSADLFYANENGSAEFVGSFGNRTAVANNDQIVAGITNGVRSAVSEVMMPYLSQIADNTRETANKDFSVAIGDRDIARANVRGQRSMGRTLISTT